MIEKIEIPDRFSLFYNSISIIKWIIQERELFVVHEITMLNSQYHNDLSHLQTKNQALYVQPRN